MSERALAANRLGWRALDGPTAAFAAGIVIVCVTVGAGVSLALPKDFDAKAALIGAFVVCALAALGPILVLGRGAAREPIVYYPVIAFFGLAGSSLVWLGEPEGEATAISLARTDVTKALLVVAAGFAAMWVGWFVTRGARATRPRARLAPSDLPSRRLTIALAVVGLFSLVVLVTTGSYGFLRDFETGGPLGPWTEWLTASQSGLDIAVALAAFRAFGTSDRVRARPDLILLIVLLILQFGAGLLSGTKVYFILPRLLVVVFIYSVFHHRMPFRWVFVFVIAMALAFPVVQQFRALSKQPDAHQDAPSLVIGGIRATMQDIGGSAALALDKLNTRARQIENVAVIIRDTPSVFPHTHGNELPKALAVAVVPRVVWPDKPVLDDATRFPQLYLKQETDSRSGTGPSHFGDLYRMFGMLGVMLGMGVFGGVFAVLGRITERAGLRMLLIVAFSLTALIRDEESFALTILAFTHIMAPVFLAVLLLPRSSFK